MLRAIDGEPEETGGSDEPEGEPRRWRAGDVVGGKYRLLKVRGKGGIATVWRAHNVALDVEVALKHSTMCSYRVIVAKHLFPVWRDKRLDQITRADIKTLLLSLQRTLAPATVNNIRVLISGIMTHAAHWRKPVRQKSDADLNRRQGTS